VEHKSDRFEETKRNFLHVLGCRNALRVVAISKLFLNRRIISTDTFVTLRAHSTRTLKKNKLLKFE
jgi:hypothetical protein